MIKTILSHCRLYVLCAMMLFVIRGVAQVGTTAERFDMPYHVNSMSLSSDSSYICMTFMQSGRTARYAARIIPRQGRKIQRCASVSWTLPRQGRRRAS